MTLSSRDRRALAWMGVSALLSLAYYFWPDSTSSVVAPSGDSTALTETRLGKLREAAASIPAKQDVLKKVSAERASREKGTIEAATAAQAQAQLLQIIRKLASAENPPIEIRATELNGIKPMADDYGEVSVAVQIDCKIDQLVNLLSSLPAQNELIATSDLRVISSNTKEKTVNVRVTLSGVVPKRLVPVKPKTPGGPA